MPNHVTNVLIIGGVSDSRLDEIRNAITGVEEDGTVVAIDFNKIIPMPPSLSVESSSVGDQGLAHLHPELSHYDFYTGAEGKKRWKELGKKRQAEALRIGRIYYDNLQKYGHTTWYSWCNAVWGTKWNAYSISSPAKNEIQFDTAWASPEPVIRALAKMFPDATFTVSFADEDIGHNVGRYTYKGRKVEYDLPEGGSDEAMQLAIEIKGMQDEMVKDEKTGEWKWVSELDDALNTLIGDGVVQVKIHDDHTAEIENEAEAKANEG